MTNTVPDVVVGIDTHADTQHAAVVSMTGVKLADANSWPPRTATGGCCTGARSRPGSGH